MRTSFSPRSRRSIVVGVRGSVAAVAAQAFTVRMGALLSRGVDTSQLRHPLRRQTKGAGRPPHPPSGGLPVLEGLERRRQLLPVLPVAHAVLRRVPAGLLPRVRLLDLVTPLLDAPVDQTGVPVVGDH